MVSTTNLLREKNKEDQKANKEKHLIDRYLKKGYDPLQIYEPAEYEYKKVVRILTAIDIMFGVLPQSALKNINKT